MRRTVFKMSVLGARLLSPLGAFIARAEEILLSDIVLAAYNATTLRTLNYDQNAVELSYFDPTTSGSGTQFGACTINPNRIMSVPTAGGSPEGVFAQFYDYGGPEFGWRVSGDLMPMAYDAPAGPDSGTAISLATNRVMVVIDEGGATGRAACFDYDGANWSNIADSGSIGNPRLGPSNTAGLSSTEGAYVTVGGGIVVLEVSGGVVSPVVSLSGDYLSISAISSTRIAVLQLVAGDDVELLVMDYDGSTLVQVGTARVVGNITSDTSQAAVAAVSENAVVISLGGGENRLAYLVFNGYNWTEVTSLAGSFTGLECMTYRTWTYDESQEFLAAGTVVPSEGAAAGGTQVAVTGTGFSPSATVEFDGVAATSVTVESSRVITCTTPAGTGTVDVTIIDGSPTLTIVGAFTYLSDPLTIISITPNSGTSAGGTSVTIVGTGFSATMDVTFVDLGIPFLANATNIVVVDSETITCDTPAWPGTGAVTVTVTDTTTMASDSLINGYTYT